MAKFSEMSGFLCRYDGRDAVGARARFYNAGGNTPKTVYQDGNLNSAFAPDGILSDANGQLPDIWVSGTTAYRCVVTFQGAVIRDRDYIPGEAAASGGGGGGGGTTELPTGFIFPYYGTGSLDDYAVRGNGRTIGSAASGASERASDDTENLFVHLWGADATLAVSGGRGATGEADFAANKQLTLPDFRGRVPAGLDDMGNTAAGRFSGITFTAGNATTLGSTAGAATVSLTSDQNGPHTHTGTTGNAGDHNHTGTTATGGEHTHTGSALAAGGHSHGGSTGAAGLHTHTGSTTAVNDHVHSYLDGGAAGSNSVGIAAGANVPSTGDTARTTGGSGAHLHALVIDAVGAHAHSITAAADHTHTLSVSTAAAHSHTYTTNTVAAHQHSFTTASAGLGSAHSNMQPSILVTYYIKL